MNTTVKQAEKTFKKLTQQSIIIKTSRKWRADKNKILQQKNRALLQSDLESQRPRPHNASVSHTQHIGGYALCQNAMIGFDLEPASRSISPKAAIRIGSPDERRLVANPLHMWVIKEACWKALKGPLQPATISQIKIVGFRKIRGHNIYKYSYKASKIKHLRGCQQGLLIFNESTVMGISVYFSQL